MPVYAEPEGSRLGWAPGAISTADVMTGAVVEAGPSSLNGGLAMDEEYVHWLFGTAILGKGAKIARS